MKNDTTFDILKYQQYCQFTNQPCVFYHGLRDVYFNPHQLGNDMKKGSISPDEDCSIIFNKFISATTNFNVVLEFARPISTTDGLIFKINGKHLRKDDKLVFCDISWVSEFPDEFEILIAPCVLNVHVGDFSQEKKSKIKIVGADVAAIEHFTEPETWNIDGETKHDTNMVIK